MAVIQVVVESLGESITQAILVSWSRKDGEAVKVDDVICELETDKANVEMRAKAAGVFRHTREAGSTVNVGETIAEIDPQGVPTAAPAASAATPVKAAAPVTPAPVAQAPAAQPPRVPPEDLSPAVRTLVMENNIDARSITPTGPGGRLTKEDVVSYIDKGKSGNGATKPASAPVAASLPFPVPAPTVPALADAAGQRREPMSKLRQRIAQILVKAQQTAAILTTFNEVDMTAIQELRAKYKERFQEVHGVGLGFMSFFARATAVALKEIPNLNAYIDGTDIIYHDYVHLGVAVSTERGLTVPVIKNVEHMSFAHIEAEIKRVAIATRDGKLSVDELSGGTFTITNGGVFGSLLSTPIINPPQSGILGMHSIQKRAVVINDKVEVRPMMYVALSYDHRIVDGKQAITYLVRLKQLLEDPTRLVLEI